MDLTPLLNPSTIALIGASDDKSRLGGLVLNNLLKEFEGAITPVNPNRSEVQGVPAVSSIASIDYVPDLAVIASPAKTVVPAVQDCIERGVKGLIVISSGFAETGEEGRVLQDELVRMTTAAGVPMVGPNCVGVISLPSKMRASFVRLMGIPMRAGATAVVSQSGAVGLSLFEQAQLCGVGSSYLATTGNEAGVTCAQLIEHVIDDDDVNVVLAYLEGIRDPDRLLAAGLRSAELGKPIVALKVGSSVSGGKAAVSHTGAMAVPDAMVDALLDRAGIIRVHSIRQMMDYAKAFAPGTRIGGKKTVILTGSGGTGVMMADAAESAGLDLAAPSPVLRPTLERLVPAIGSIANPIDHTAQIINEPENYEALVRAVTAAPEYDAVVMGNVSRAQGTDLLDLLEEVGNSSSNVLVAHSHYPEIVTDLASRGVRSTDDPEAALEMVAVMSRFETRRQEILSEDHEVLTASRLSAMADDTHVASSSEARALLEKAGVRFPSEFAVIDEDEAALCWGKIGGPVALKIDADWMPHKTEHGGLILGLNTESDVRVAFERLRSIAQTLAPDGATTAFVVQEMIPPGIELICGGLRNPLFGPIISVGVGGVLTEIIQLRGLTLAPVSSAEARRLLCRLADGRLVQSVRGLDESQIEAVVEAIVGLGDLLSAHDDIAEIEVNPLIVTASGVVAVDALVSLASTG